METVQVDCRGLSCPEPVLLATRAIAAGARSLEVQLNSEVAVENVSRLARARGFQVTRTEEAGGGTVLHLARD